MVIRGRRCFICQPSAEPLIETPGQWSSPRFLCGPHAVGLRLSDGQLIEEVLNQAAPPDHALEGSSLGWIYNPVFVRSGSVGTARAWIDFAAGGMTVYENRFDAATYFEFRALEVPAAVDLLYTVKSDRLDTPIATISDVIRIILSASSTSPPPQTSGSRGPANGLTELVGVWNFQSRLEAIRASSGHRWPGSFAELEEWLRLGRGPDEPEVDREPQFVQALKELAVRRFHSQSSDSTEIQWMR